uniref:Fe2OG dioxygenase domain-containing protein n=1 Tax=Lygus hesperus TaxID=30085 RepID=A0A0K8SZ75_LYGHE
MMEVSEFRVTNAPSDLYYLPNFISEEEEKFILDKVYAAPKPKWVQLLNRRLQHWGGSPSKNGMIVEPIPSWLQSFMDRIDKLNIFDDSNVKTNHVLINEYRPGQGIMPHEDGPMFYPTIATISCGSSTVLKFEKKPSEANENDASDLPETAQVFLERRSLVIVKGELYTNYLHSIEERSSDTVDSTSCNFETLSRGDGDKIERETRISLTIRHVLKVSKFKFRLRT